MACWLLLFHLEGQTFHGVEREFRAWQLELTLIPRIAHEHRILGTFTHHVRVNKVVQTDESSVFIRCGQICDLCILQDTDIPRNADDQSGYVDGRFARDHFLPMCDHAHDG